MGLLNLFGGAAKGIGTRALAAPETTAVHGLMSAEAAPVLRPPGVAIHNNTVVHGMWGEGRTLAPAVNPTTPKDWAHVTPPGVAKRTIEPSPAAAADTSKEWTHVTPQAAADRRNMPSSLPLRPTAEPSSAVPPTATPNASAAPKQGWGIKKKLAIGGGLAATGWIGNDMMHSFNAPQPTPEQYQTASDEDVMLRLEKTAHTIVKEASEMGLMQRLQKTASVVEAIHAIAQATGQAPEEVAQLADTDPEQFSDLVQQVMGDAGTGDGDGDEDDIQPEAQGMPTQPGAVQQPASPAQPEMQAQPEAQTEPVNPISASASNMLQEAPQPGAPVDPQMQAVPQPGAPVDPQVQQSQVGVAAGGAVDHTALLQAVSQAASEGAAQGVAQAIEQMGSGAPDANPRSGAASVSHNPAGVDKTASNSDLLIARLEQTADALTDVTKAMRNGNQPAPGQTDEQKTAALMVSLEKTAEENSVAGLVGKGALIGGVIGGALSMLSGAGATGLVPGAALGAGVGGLKYLMRSNEENREPQELEELEEHEASEALMDSLEKTALSLGGIGAGIKSYVRNVSGAGVRGATKDLSMAKEQREIWNQPVAFSHNAQNVGVSNARNHLDTLDKGVEDGVANLGKARDAHIKALGSTALVGAGTLGGMALNNNRQKTAADIEIEEEQKTEKTPAPKSNTPPEGPAGQHGTEGYVDQDAEKKASENESFMNGIFKEAAAHIIEMEMPKTKIHVDPMHRIKF